MKPSLFPAAAAAILFLLYAFFGDAAFSLVVGLFIGTMVALYFFNLIGLNGAVFIGVAVFVLYQFIGNDMFYLFGLLFGLFFCLVGLYAVSGLLRPVKGQGKLLLLLAMVAPVSLGLGGYLVWVDATELGLWSLMGLPAQL